MPPQVRSLVRSAFPPPAGPDDRSDAELLARFLGHQDAAAFAVLLRRHGPMVRAVCHGVLRNPADADDAFQATFLVLVRRAEAIRDRAAVGAWLYGVAGRVSRKLRSQLRPQTALPDDLPAPPAPDAAFDTRAVLEEEVARLPERYRLVVQACYVAGQTTAEAAARLGWAKGTVLTRLAWARKRLRARLSARGVSLAAGGFGTLLSRPAARAVGRELQETTARAALAAAAGEAVAGRSMTLSEGVIRAMVLNKLKWVGGAVLAAAVLAGVGVGRWTAEAAGEPQAKNKPVPQSRDLPPPARDELLPPPNVPRTPADPLVGASSRDAAPLLPLPATDRVGPLPTPVSNTLPPPPIPWSNTIPAAAVPGAVGKTFIVSRPVGTWTREVATENNSPLRITAKFEEDRLTIRWTHADGKDTAEMVLDADYSITRDSVVFGVVTGCDVTATANGGPGGEDDFTDQPFSFRFRVDNGVLTVKDFRMPGLKDRDRTTDALVGRFTAAADLPGDKPPAPAPAKPKPVAPRRGSASPSLIAPQEIPSVPNVGAIPSPTPLGSPVLPGSSR